MVSFKLIKCAFGFHQYSNWYLAKHPFTSGNEVLANRDCYVCRLYESRWLPKRMFKEEFE